MIVPPRCVPCILSCAASLAVELLPDDVDELAKCKKDLDATGVGLYGRSGSTWTSGVDSDRTPQHHHRLLRPPRFNPADQAARRTLCLEYRAKLASQAKARPPTRAVLQSKCLAAKPIAAARGMHIPPGLPRL